MNECPECAKLSVVDTEEYYRLNQKWAAIPRVNVVGRCQPIMIDGKMSYFIEIKDMVTESSCQTQNKNV